MTPEALPGAAVRCARDRTHGPRDRRLADSRRRRSRAPDGSSRVATSSEARLGRGAFKEVYLAHDERLDREVALAIVVGAGRARPPARASSARPGVTGRLGDHPNVVTVYDTGEVDGRALPRAARHAGRLAGRCARGRAAVTRPTCPRSGRDVAAALAHAHAHGVVHRDVKPDNVWLAADGTAALGDFGVAHEVGADRLTAEGVVVGTVRYVAPEQIRGEEAGPATDLYAWASRSTSSSPGARRSPDAELGGRVRPAPGRRAGAALGVRAGRRARSSELILALLAKAPRAAPRLRRATVAEALAALTPAAPAAARSRRPRAG